METAGTTTDVESDPLKKGLTHGLAFWAIVAPVWLVVANGVHHQFALDFHYAFVPAAHAVVHGASPYVGVKARLVGEGVAYIYPPLTAYLFAPFTLLPSILADVLATVLVAATVPATLLVLGIRDWRCHAIAFLWMPTVAGMQSANLTLPMVLGLALVWRYREHSLVTALVTGFVVALKLFFWPLLVWLVATRRYRSAALAAAASTALVIIPWAGVGFEGLRAYPHLLTFVSRREGPGSYSVAALLHFAVPNWAAATAVETAIGIVVLLFVLAAGRRGCDREAFALAVIGIFVLTPLLEIHYLAVLLVVVALFRDRLSSAWIVPLLLWGAPEPNEASDLQRIHVLFVVALAVTLAVTDWKSWTTDLSFGRSGERLAKWLGSSGRKGAGSSLAPP